MSKLVVRQFYVRCAQCDGHHPTAYCRVFDPAPVTSHTPLETPSHNGPWQGRMRVREVAPGVSGADLGIETAHMRSRRRGNHRRRVSRMQIVGHERAA